MWYDMGMTERDFPPFAPDGNIEWFTVREVAELGGVSTRRVRELCRTGKLWAVKRAGVWLIPNVTAWAWVQRDRKPGRPRKEDRPLSGEQLGLDLNE